MTPEQLDEIAGVKFANEYAEVRDRNKDAFRKPAYISGFKKGIEYAEQSRWIPVEERLPEIDERVLIANKFGLVSVCYFKRENIWQTENTHECPHYVAHWQLANSHEYPKDVTHWQPLPTRSNK